MKWLLASVLCAVLLMPTVAYAHDWSQADATAVDAMGYRAWATAHNAAAPSDAVPSCIPATAQVTPNQSLEGVNRCTPAEQYAAQIAAYQQAQLNAAMLQAYAAVLAAYAGSSPDYGPRTVSVNGRRYTCWNLGLGWDCNG